MTVSTNMHDDIEEVLITEDMLQARIASLAAAIAQDYRGKDLLLVGILRGAIMFMVDLAKRLPLPLDIDFMAISSYGDTTESSGVVRILKDLDEDIGGKDVLMGCIDVATERVETPEDVAALIAEAQRYVPAERLYPCTNCGMVPMAATSPGASSGR